MGLGGKKSVEQIKQEIEFYKENLKFLNSFYLPIGTGIVIQFTSNSPMLYKAAWLLHGSLAMVLLTFFRKKMLHKINTLIKGL